MTAATPGTMTKGEFAALCNVAKSRVSHWIRDGRINGAALVGTGRAARIDVAVAQKQLKGNLDPYQMLQGGNGAKTRLDAPTPEPASEPLSDDAAKLWDLLSEVPSDAAWHVARAGETTQRAFDVFMDMRLDTAAELRRRGFDLPDGIDHFPLVDWRELANEIGLTFIDPKRMAADWQRRRDAE